MPTQTVDITLPRPHEKQRAVKQSPTSRKVVCAGRRGGKTTLATEVAIERMLEGGRVLLASATQEQADAFWDKAKTWLHGALEAGVMSKNESRRIIESKTGGRIRAKTAYNADSLRGDHAEFLVLDEAALMEESAWEDVAQPMLLDNDGDAWLISTPPKTNVNKHWFTKKFRRGQSGDPNWASFRFTSHDNPHISAVALKQIGSDMTRQTYRREILAEFVEPEGALWSWNDIENNRDPSPPNMRRIVIGVDPAGGGPDEIGIIVCGKSGSHGYVLTDGSMKGSPNAWASKVVTLYRQWKADRVIAERNFGGDMVESTLRMADQHLPVKVISASRGKQQRAEPVAALYEQGKVHHVGSFEDLEDQMTTWDPEQSNESPDRVDALVWALTELMVDTPANTGAVAHAHH